MLALYGMAQKHFTANIIFYLTLLDLLMYYDAAVKY